ncbi:60 kDa SS-A/Ro ribonucleoprotein [Gonapodya sp. JEL0774]|nr:60 kDa SS-A/Ro ribonucleoprotein [Gonapodya sp. JEL0774]
MQNRSWAQAASDIRGGQAPRGVARGRGRAVAAPPRAAAVVAPQPVPAPAPARGGRARGSARGRGRGAARRGQGTTGQMLPIPGKEHLMVTNNAGGVVFKVADSQQLRRFLVLGAAGGTYYVRERELKLENAMHIKGMIEEGQGREVVETVLEFSVNGRTPKQDTLTFALALALTFGDQAVRTLVYQHLAEICRIPTTLFAFLEYTKLLGGTTHPKSGRGLRSAIGKWYNGVAEDIGETAVRQAFACTKYKNRNGWKHADVLRVFHVKPKCEEAALLYKYLTQPWKSVAPDFEALRSKLVLDPVTTVEEDFVVVARPEEDAAPAADNGGEVETVQQRKQAKIAENRIKVASKVTMSRLIEFLTALEEITPIAQITEDTEAKVVDAIKRWKFAREHVPSPLLNSRAVWEALLVEMPMTAMMRNLAKMTSVGLIAPLSEASATIVKRLKNANALKKAKMHPFNVLLALRTYQRGRGFKGELTWAPDQTVVAALEDAFYLSFQAVEQTGKKFLLALDVSGSMTSPIMDSPMSCREASAALSMVTARTEENCHFFGFCHQFVPLKITRNATLQEVERTISGLPFGSTDCSLPMVYALEKNIPVDVFVVYTDNETYAGRVQPVEALESYRKAINPEAKLVVVGMTATKFTIADPEDPGMMDIVGFDSGALQAMGEFVSGRV